MLRVKLIQPRMERRPMDTAIKSRMAPPLGLLTVALCRLISYERIGRWGEKLSKYL